MTEEWRRALDKNLVVGIAFVDFRKVFVSISYQVLLEKLQAVGITGDLWCWIKDYLADRSQVTVVNRFQTETLACLRDLFWDLPCFRCFAMIYLI